MKKISRLGLLISLLIVFTMFFSTMALAAEAATTGSQYQKTVHYQIMNADQWDSFLKSNPYLNKYFNKIPNNIKTSGQKPTPTPAPVPTPKPAPTPQPTPAPTLGLSVDEQEMVDLVNKERLAAGLPALKVDMSLVNTARMKSQDMIDKNYFDHNSPTYGSPFDLMKSQGITYRTAGENLAGNQTVTNAHKTLMNSSGHRANILNKNFTKIGIGIINGGSYGKMFTQHFIG